MAKSADISKVRLARYDVTIDGDRYHRLKVVLALGYAEIPIETDMAGAVPIGDMVAGATATGSIEFRETDKAFREKVHQITSALPLAIGAIKGTHLIELHDPADGEDDTGDIIIPKAVFAGPVSEDNDGKKDRVWAIGFAGRYDATCDGGWKLRGAAP